MPRYFFARMDKSRRRYFVYQRGFLAIIGGKRAVSRRAIGLWSSCLPKRKPYDHFRKAFKCLSFIPYAGITQIRLRV